MYVITNRQHGFCIGPGGFDSAADAWAWFGKSRPGERTRPWACVWVKE